MSAAAQQPATRANRAYFTAAEGVDTSRFMMEQACQSHEAPALIIVPRDRLTFWMELSDEYAERLPHGVTIISPGNLKLCQNEAYGIILHEVVDFGFAQYPQLQRLIALAPVYMARVERPEKNLGNGHHLPGERKAPPSTYLRFVNNNGLASDGHWTKVPQY